MAGEIATLGSRRSWLSAASISRSLRAADPDDPFRRSAASRGGDGDDDEENLRWAALEKLPTYDRMRRGIIRRAVAGGEGKAADEVDIANLDPRDGRELMERVFKAVEDDNERFLRRFKDRLDLVGIELPQIEVRYEHLSIEADVYVGKRALPTLLNAAINTLEMLQPEEILDKALTMMQRTSTRLMDFCKEKLHPGKSMSAIELKELREVLEIIAEGLEQDSLLCQESLDEFKKAEEVYPDTPSDVSEPPYSPERHPDDFLSLAEHIEKFWGVDYDSDHMPNFSD